MIKKYHLADLFTLLEVILAVALLWMAIMDCPVDWALWIFVGGEICDALDGPCARKWHYPNDGKHRWWRTYNSEIDQISDILLAVACGVYLIWRVNWLIGVLLLGGIGTFCLLVQCHLYYYDQLRRSVKTNNNILYADRLILFRRRFYVVAGVGGAIATLVWYSSWPFWLKLGITLSAPFLVKIGARVKSNRWRENKTKL